MNYTSGEILSVASEADDLIIRILSEDPNPDTDRPVTQITLKACKPSAENLETLTTYIFEEMDLCFQEENDRKYLELASVRLDYVECETQQTPYNVAELVNKLKHIQDQHFIQANRDWKRYRKVNGILHRLKQEITKEVDRLERKQQFFAQTKKAGNYDERLRCNQRVLDWIEILEKDETG